jgi:hypothetical protein
MEMLHKFDMAIIVVSVIVLIGVVGYASPLVIAPLDDYETTDTGILFSIENADVIIVDDNSEFTSPEEYSVSPGLRIDLKPGKYYWRAVGAWGSEIRTLTINSEVSLELRKLDGAGGYGIINVGNTRLNVEVYNGTELIDRVKLDSGEDANSVGNKFIGGSDE